MTEYTTSSQAVREYMTSRERTAYWVQSHSPEEVQLYSPSAAPSVINGLVPSSPPSEVESSHSIPPKMVLRYSDGRPDMPIPRADDTHDMTRSGSKRRGPSPHSRSQTQSHNSHHRSKSGSDAPSGVSPWLGGSSSHRHDHRERFPPHSPEEIRILPSQTQEPPRSSSHHSRSKSLPRNAYSSSHGATPPTSHHSSSHHSQLPPIHTSKAYYTQDSSVPPVPPLPQLPFSQPQPSPWFPNAGRSGHVSQKRGPPAIVYAPSHHSKSHYAPPAIYSHPPKVGPNGMIYSHSAPVPQSRYPPAGATPYPSDVASSSHRSSPHEEKRSRSRRDMGSARDRSRSITRSGAAAQPSPSSSSSSLDSDDSGSTYYVLPSAGQKVHVIVS